MTFNTKGTIYCPRCDRKYPTSEGSIKVRVAALKRHVRLNHPDHDPEWYDTYPYSDDWNDTE